MCEPLWVPESYMMLIVGDTAAAPFVIVLHCAQIAPLEVLLLTSLQ